MVRGVASPDRLVGRARHELPTPALLLDLDRARRNIAELQRRLPAGIRHRPHTKIHKSAELARLQLQAGATGATVATVYEALAFAEAGFDDLLIANEVVGADKTALLARLALNTRIGVAVDDRRNVDALAAACRQAGSNVQAFVDVDVGVGRCGVRSAGEAATLAEHIAQSGSLELGGVLGYEGHAMLLKDVAARRSTALAAYGRLAAAVAAIRDRGMQLTTVSAGGTGTYELAREAGVVTEVRAGSYVLMDRSYCPITPEFEIASTVLSTVISRKRDMLVVDCGSKTIDVQLELPAIAGHVASARYVAEEHLVFDVPPSCNLDLGSTVELVPVQCGSTVNLHDAHHVVEGDVVVDVWRVLARGPGRNACGMSA